MVIISVSGLNELQDIQLLIWLPVSQILLAVFIYFYLSIVDKSILSDVKIKLGIIIFSVTYGLPLIMQTLMTIMF